jgi:nicotinamidase-related amidase
MSTLGRANSALVIIDVQNEVVESAHNRDEIVANIQRAVTKARENQTQVIWVQHSDEFLPINSDGWQIVPELVPTATEPIIKKLFRSSFEETDLEEFLLALDIGHLYICGAETNNCVRHTSHAALERGYDITLLADAHTTTDWHWQDRPVFAAQVIDEANQAFYDYRLPGRSAISVAVSEAKL